MNDGIELSTGARRLASKVISVTKSVAPLGGIFFEVSILIGMRMSSHGAPSIVSRERVISGGLMSRMIVISAVPLKPLVSVMITLYVQESEMIILSEVAPVLQSVEAKLP